MAKRPAAQERGSGKKQKKEPSPAEENEKLESAQEDDEIQEEDKEEEEIQEEEKEEEEEQEEVKPKKKKLAPHEEETQAYAFEVPEDEEVQDAGGAEEEMEHKKPAATTKKRDAIAEVGKTINQTCMLVALWFLMRMFHFAFLGGQEVLATDARSPLPKRSKNETEGGSPCRNKEVGT